MCGLTGEVRLDGGAANVAAVAAMMDSMRCRGPDADGLLSSGPVALGHRRLKIIDLSGASSQPLSDPHLGLSVVFNGAIYNYRELRTELEGLGYRFFSSGDTEVILKSYHAWGERCVERFNGMFAFAVVARDDDRVFLARDRLGIKPLYYSRSGTTFRFASSLPAILAAGGVDTSIDAVALNYYMSFHAVVPAPHTILNGVRKLPPASTAYLGRDGELAVRRYWNVQFGTPVEHASRTEEQWVDALAEVMGRAVERRLVADVPVGVLLSGGLDSSLIVGLLNAAGQRHIETFSIGFEAVGGEAGDEFQYSDIIAKRFETRHHQLRIPASRTLPALDDCIAAMSEPMVSHDNVGFYLLSQEVAKYVKVVQSGQGADEVFAGYHWYPPMVETEDALATYRAAFFDRSHAEYAAAVSPLYQVDDFASRFVADHFSAPGAELPIDKALRLDTEIMLVDDPVKRVDNHTMAASLEARVPFLDHELVEFAATVPAHLKVAGGGKYLLKQLGRRIIPSEVIDRPKGYFPVPALKYLRGDFLELARRAVSCEAARERGLFQADYVQRLLAAPEEHLTPLRGSKLWQLALLELWLQKHLDQ